MSRDSNGNYQLPVGNPVQTDTVIESNWANSTMGDLKIEMTNSLDRQGRGGMQAPLKGVNGSNTTPAFAFTNQFNTGMYLAAADDLRFAVDGADALQILKGVDLTFNDGTFTLNDGAVTYESGTYLFDGVGLELDGSTLYIGDSATGDTVLTTGNLTAALVPYDNTVTGQLNSDNVQGAIDELSAGAQTYSSVPRTNGQQLLAGVMNELLDDTLPFPLPLASSTQVNAQIGISVPDTAAAFKPFVERTGTDLITFRDGTDTDMQFNTPATIWLTSNGVDTWRY